MPDRRLRGNRGIFTLIFCAATSGRSGRLKENFDLTFLGLFPIGKSPSGKGMVIKMISFNSESEQEKQRIVQELVPGRQITLAHLIANPDQILYEKLGLDPRVEYSKSAIGVMTVSPAETAIIMADIAVKSSGAELGFVDRFSGSLIITGSVSEVEAAVKAILDYCRETLGYTVCPVTKT